MHLNFKTIRTFNNQRNENMVLFVIINLKLFTYLNIYPQDIHDYLLISFGHEKKNKENNDVVIKLIMVCY